MAVTRLRHTSQHQQCFSLSRGSMGTLQQTLKGRRGRELKLCLLTRVQIPWNGYIPLAYGLLCQHPHWGPSMLPWAAIMGLWPRPHSLCTPCLWTCRNSFCGPCPTQASPASSLQWLRCLVRPHLAPCLAWFPWVPVPVGRLCPHMAPGLLTMG